MSGSISSLLPVFSEVTTELTTTKQNSRVCHLLGSCLNSTPQLPGKGQVGLDHHEWGYLRVPLSLTLLLPACSSLVLLGFSLPFSHFPRSHGQPLLLYPPLLSAFLCLYYSLNSLPQALNNLYSILYGDVAGLSGAREALAWAC